MTRPPNAIERPGVADHYRERYAAEGKIITDAYSLPTADPNIHDLKIEWVWSKDAVQQDPPR